MRQGQGQNTARKEQGFRIAFAMSLRMSRAESVRHHPYWHIDLNCGCGWNEKAGCPGSPFVFLEEAQRQDRLYRAYFCDHDQQAVFELGKVIQPEYEMEDSEISCLACDNSECLDQVEQDIYRDEPNPSFALGTCCCDPNGRIGLPVERLARFARQFPRIDLILNVNLSLEARVRGCKKSQQAAISKGFQDWPEAEQIVEQLGRNDWYIRNPSRGGTGERFTILIGRTKALPRRRFEEFVPLDSLRGQEIIRTLKRIRPEQETLFD